MSGLVLELFPGISLFGMAFEEVGFCVVRGPDLLWGGDVRRFHPTAGRFDGVIGGPPCQAHSTMRGLNPNAGRHGDMIPEFIRCVEEARPLWFLMENVPDAPVPLPKGFRVGSWVLNNRWFGEDQNRERRFSFGQSSDAAANLLPHIRFEAFDSPRFECAVLAGHGPALGQRVRGIQGRTWQEGARLQGLSPEWIRTMEKETPFTVHGFKRVVGNGVPLPMGRALARAVKAAVAP